MEYRKLNPDQYVVSHDGQHVNIRPCHSAMEALEVAFEELLRRRGASDNERDPRVAKKNTKTGE